MMWKTSEDEFCVFARGIVGRISGFKWPPADAEFWEGVRAALDRFPRHDGWVDRLLGLVQIARPRCPDDLPRIIVEEARKTRDTDSVGGSDTLGDRHQAAVQSRNCPICDGNGLVICPHPHSGIATTYLCRCPLGRWIKQHNPKQSRLLELPDSLVNDLAREQKELQAAQEHDARKRWAAMSEQERKPWKWEVCLVYPELAKRAASGSAWARLLATHHAMMAAYRVDVLGLPPFDDVAVYSQPQEPAK